MAELSDKERLDWLRLARTHRIGPVTFAQLLAVYGSATRALDAAPQLARKGGSKLELSRTDDALRELDAIAKLGGRLIASCEPDYPHGLKALDAPPPVLTLIGHSVLLHREMVAMVGARNASALGRKLAYRMAADLGQAGLAVVSGLARGIDAAAHEGALTTGTVAVVAGGVDVVYPPENQPLYERICAEGVVLSEMPPGQAPQARHFPRRNRIISGLSRGVVVVEAAVGSGSLITAHDALDQGREVFAVPGSPLDPRAKGTNCLIRDGAVLTEGAADVLSVLAPMLRTDFCEPAGGITQPPPSTPDEGDLARIRRQISEALGPAPVSVDDLIRICGGVTAVLTVLLEMELAGKITRHHGNLVSWGAGAAEDLLRHSASTAAR